MFVHPSITLDLIINAVQSDDYIGFCANCGAQAEQCEPDTRERLCDACGTPSVYGAEELLIRLTP